MPLIVGWVTRKIRSEKGEYGEAIVVEEKIPVVTCAKAKRAAGASPSFFRFGMRIEKRASVNQTQKPVRTVVWPRCNHSIRPELDNVRVHQTSTVLKCL